MYDHNYIAVPRPLANGGTPIIINNACGSWHRLAETFTFGNARAYIGTLFPISTSEVHEVIARLIDKEFRKPLPAAIWSAQRKVYNGTDRRPYVVTGVYTQWLRATRRDVPKEILSRLEAGYSDWVGFLSNTDPSNQRFRATEDIVRFHERGIAHFKKMAD
jgi:hypothetical protein